MERETINGLSAVYNRHVERCLAADPLGLHVHSCPKEFNCNLPASGAGGGM